MRPAACLALPFSLLLGACAAAPRAEPAWQRVEFAAGPFGLAEDSWAPLDGRVLGALTWSTRKPEWPCGVEVGVQYARAESRDHAISSGADFLDLRAGAAWEWRPQDWLSLVTGAGPRLGLVSATVPGGYMPGSERAASLGVYAHAGAFLRVSERFAVGLEAQWAEGTDYDLLGASHDGGSRELLLALRWEF